MKKLYKNWLVHNCIAHPLMQFVGMFDYGLARKIHNGTLPKIGKGEIKC